MLSGAKAFVDALKRENVKLTFGIPGAAILPVFEELRTSEMRHILTRHEQGAAHMADGYARATGKVGVCIATSGPGATNMVTGIATAYMDSSPIVAVTGQVPRGLVGKDAFQEADITGIINPVTKHSYQPIRPSDVPWMVKAAFHIASTGRPGPVLIDLPRDVQVAVEDVKFPVHVELPGYKPTVEPHPLQLKKAVDLLVKAEKPIILAGGGVIIANATMELLRLVDGYGIPTVTTFLGKGAIPEGHPLSLGKIGLYGREAGNHAVCEADVILAVGVRFSDRSVVTLDNFGKNAKIIHIDIDPSEIGKNIDVTVPIVADAKLALQGILKTLTKVMRKEQPKASWLKRIQELKEQFNRTYEDIDELCSPRVLRHLRRLLPQETITTADVGLNQMWAGAYFDCYTPRSFISSGGLGPMGFGFPAALGVRAAFPEKPVVCITGDGGFLMTQAEMATSISNDLPVITVVFNNRTLGMVAQIQRLFLNRHYFSVDLGGTPDFPALAKAYGAEGIRIQSYDELTTAVKNALNAEVTTLIEVPISREETLPSVPPGMSLDAAMLEG